MIDEKNEKLGRQDGCILNGIENIFKKYLILPDHAATALSLYVIYTYCHDAFYISPRCLITSPDKRCGKTTTLLVLSRLAHNGNLSSSVTAASIYRGDSKQVDTLIIDEADTYLKGNTLLTGIINSGHSRDTAFVSKAVKSKNDFVTKKFSTFMPIIISMIGKPASTLLDRCILISMRRKMPGEGVSRLRLDRPEEFYILRGEIREWVKNHMDDLKKADPVIPDDLHDRAADNWRCLLAIADAVGGEWSQKAREASIALSQSDDSDIDDSPTQLLQDIHDIFLEEKTDKLFSSQILKKLHEMIDRPWPEYQDGKELTHRQMVQILQCFKIKPHNIWIDGKQNKGYELYQFQEAFDRYISK